uniref:Uncharacterized protein n=1 Tax=Oncorhynchus mykiss TaxID=8022 RepID=A0A8C7W494_ONCMY
MPLSKPEKLLEHELSCPICLELYTDPVYLPCGHNYCLACINATDASSGEKSLPCCPECREEYSGTETLHKNFKLCGIIEGYRAIALVENLGREPLEVRCDHCLDTETLEEMRRVLESRSKEVANRLQLTETLLQRAAEDQGTSDAVGDKLMSTAVALMDSMAGLVSRYRDRMSLLLEEERGHQRKIWQSGLGLLEEQQKELMEANQSSAEVLSVTDKHLFIHRFLLIESQLTEVVTGTVARVLSKEPLNTKRLQASLRMNDFRAEMGQLLQALNVQINPLELTFNITTAHPSLLLSNDLRTVKYIGIKQASTDNLERFSTAPQVLCSQSFTSGEHIWVVEVGDQSMWSVGLCYKSVPRRGDHSRLGHNPVSWRLQWKNKKLTVCHASSNMALVEKTNQPLRVEVALDYEGGTLIFHSTKGCREHLHTFKAVFREPVYPAFSIHSTTAQSWITLQSGV